MITSRRFPSDADGCPSGSWPERLRYRSCRRRAGIRSPSRAARARYRRPAGSGRPRLTHPCWLDCSGAVSAFPAPAALEGAFQLPPFVFAELPGVARLEERFAIGRVTGLDRSAALELGVEFGAEQDRDVRDPQPDQE